MNFRNVRRRGTVEPTSSFRDQIAHSISDNFGHRVAIEFSHQVDAVRFRGLYTNTQNRRDFLTALTLGKKLYDFAFARGERRVFVDRILDPFRLSYIAVQANLRDFGGEEGLIATQSFDGGDQIAGDIRLEYIAASPGLHHLLN